MDDDEVLGMGVIDHQHRIVIPKRIREQLSLSQSDRVIWYTDGFNLCVKFMSPQDLHRQLVKRTKQKEFE